MIANNKNINVVNDVGAVQGLRNIARQDETEALKVAAQQFEAIMLQQLLKNSRESSWDDGFGEDMPGVGSMETYREWRDDQLAQNLSAKGSLGFADMLVKQLSPVDRQASKKDLQDMTSDVESTDVHSDTFIARTQASSGWWKMPVEDAKLLDVPQSMQTEVNLPTTEENLLLRQMLQHKLQKLPTQG